jgi:exodeoxyribonuclease VII small subunit
MAKAKQSLPQTTFEAALQELEAIVRAMEGGDAPLEESLAAYERGMALLKQCRETLTAAEQKLQVLEAGALVDAEPDPAGNAQD